MNDSFVRTPSLHAPPALRIEQGDQEILSRLFLQYYDDLYRYGYRLRPDEEFVKDCLQELFLKLWQRRQSLGDVREMRPYLFKSLRRCIIDGLRGGPHRFRLWDDADEQLLDVTFSHEDFLISQQIDQQQRQRLTHALNQLTKREREVIHLRYFEGFDAVTIAQVMGLREQSVYNLQHRAIGSLRDHFFLLLLLQSSIG